jgi:transposase-like protein
VLRDQIDAVFAEEGDLSSAIEKVARLGAQLLLQSALEAEVTEFLGRARYARSVLSDDARPGMRNGYCDTTVKTTAGPVTLKRPKLRDTDERFCSKLFGKHVTKTNALEALVIGSYVRGLSDRDVENTLAEALGGDGSVSRSTVSRICGQITEQFDAWRERDLSTVELDYLFLDASFFRYHVGAAAEPICAAWGIDTGGKPVFVGLDTASGESAESWERFLTNLGERGLACPLMVISDGAKGLIAATELAMPKALRQRCLIHRSRNLLAKVPENAQSEVKDDYWAIFDIPEGMGPGLDTVAFVQKRIDAFASRWKNSYPSAVRCILDDRTSLTEYLRMPREHWARIRHSNFIERTFGETRRRVKVIGRLPGEHSCISLVWAVLDRAAVGWRGLAVTADGQRLLAGLRVTLLAPPAALPTPQSKTDESPGKSNSVGAAA